jgi:hypothetical protein
LKDFELEFPWLDDARAIAENGFILPPEAAA